MATYYDKQYDVYIISNSQKGVAPLSSNNKRANESRNCTNIKLEALQATTGRGFALPSWIFQDIESRQTYMVFFLPTID